MAAKKKLKYDKDELISMYREMVFYRKFEEAVNLAYTKRKFSGFCHLHIGQEAVAVGVQRNLRPTDYAIGTYRTHTTAIAKGIPAVKVFAELFGREGGCSKGRGGSMHMFSAEHRFLGGHGIVGGQVPLATGAAFRIKYMKEDDVVVCFIGDGAVMQGAVHEAMNIAATWGLPVIFLIENNQYGMGTDIKRVTNIDRLYKVKEAFGMEGSDVDGMDVLIVREKIESIVKNMRKDKKPYLLEVNTYRFKGHSVSDPGTYRTKEEVQEYQKKDPIIQLGAVLVENGYATEDELKAWQKEEKQKAKDAEAEAEKMPSPKEADVGKYVFAEDV